MSDLDELAAIVRTHIDQSALRPSTAGPRIGAALIDAFILLFLNAFLSLAATLAHRAFHGVKFEMVVAMAFWAFNTAYSATEVFLRGTPGKWLLSISITARDGARPARWRLLWRWVIKYAWLLLAGVLIALTGAAWLLLVGRAGPGLSRHEAALEFLAAAVGIGFYLSAAVALFGSFGIMFPPRLALHDWLTGTAVMSELELTRRRRAAPRAFQLRGVTSTEPPPRPPEPELVDDAASEEPDEQVNLAPSDDANPPP